jgi:trans-aconitate methyltransferase
MRLDDALVRDLVAGRYAFVDAGCAAGASIDHCERRFGLGRGLGLDWYQGDLDVARNNGFDVALCNLLEQELPP